MSKLSMKSQILFKFWTTLCLLHLKKQIGRMDFLVVTEESYIHLFISY